MAIFAAIFVISIAVFFYTWLLIILFTKRLNHIYPESKKRFPLFMAIVGAGAAVESQDIRLITYIKNGEHKQFNDKKLNKLGSRITRLYYPSLIIFVFNLFSMAIYNEFFNKV